MADITDIKTIIHTEKSMALQEDGVLVVQTTQRVTKNSLKEIFKEYFGVTPLKVNSMRVKGKTKRFKNIEGKRSDSKKFFVKLPDDAKLEILSA